MGWLCSLRKRDNMTIKDKKTAGETATNLWEDGVDITKPAPNRPYKKWLEIGVLVYLTKEQYESLSRNLASVL